MSVPFFTFVSVETLVLQIWLIIYRQKLSGELSFNYSTEKNSVCEMVTARCPSKRLMSEMKIYAESFRKIKIRKDGLCQLN